MDKFTTKKRSEIMSRISGKETKPEVLVRKYLFSQGFRYRKNVKKKPGKPDIVLAKYKTIIFIHGCFWHGHTCKRGALPNTNFDFWKAKIGENIERDRRNIAELEKQGWRIIIIWQCELDQKPKNQRLSELVEEILT